MANEDATEALRRLDERCAELVALYGPGGAKRTPAPEGELPTHSEEGVDLTLIRWMLSLTPLERLQVLQQLVTSLSKLRGDRDDV